MSLNPSRDRRQHTRPPTLRPTPRRARFQRKPGISLGLLLAAVATVIAATEARAQSCQPGPWQECIQLELQCAQCGEPCYYADSGPCWEMLACQSGYYVHDRWQENKGVDCQITGDHACYLFQTYTEFEVSEVRHETWERRSCYDGSGGLFVVMTGYTSSYPGYAWRKGGSCSLVNPKPSPVIHDCI